MDGRAQAHNYQTTLIIMGILSASCCPPRHIYIPTTTAAFSTTPPAPSAPWSIYIRRWRKSPILVSGGLRPLKDHLGSHHRRDDLLSCDRRHRLERIGIPGDFWEVPVEGCDSNCSIQFLHVGTRSLHHGASLSPWSYHGHPRWQL